MVDGVEYLTWNVGLWTYTMSLLFLHVDTVAVKERQWLGPNMYIAGAPSPRQALGLSIVSGRLYVHGGQGPTGGFPIERNKYVRGQDSNPFFIFTFRNLCTNGNLI